jgi:hypothetical protein
LKARIVAPIHTGEVNGVPVRFFEGPTSMPEVPWHAVDDLHQAMGLDQRDRVSLLLAMRQDSPDELRTVATEDGPTTLAPNYVAQGMIDAIAEITGPSIQDEYSLAACEALKRLAGNLPLPESIEFARAAFRNTRRLMGGLA